MCFGTRTSARMAPLASTTEIRASMTWVLHPDVSVLELTVRHPSPETPIQWTASPPVLCEPVIHLALSSAVLTKKEVAHAPPPEGVDGHDPGDEGQPPDQNEIMSGWRRFPRYLQTDRC